MESLSVVLTNRYATFTSDIPTKYSKLLSWRKANAFFSPAFQAGHWDGFIKMIKHNRTTSGLFLATLKEARALGINFQIEDKRVYPKFKKVDLSGARKYQKGAIKALCKKAHSGGIILAATGTGKTFIAGKFFAKVRGHCVFIVDELVLLEQAKADIEKQSGEKVGVIGDKRFDPKRITVATIQTLNRHKRDKTYAKWQRLVEVVIIDELHMAMNRRNIDVVAALQPLACFGLTATLQLTKAEVRLRAAELCGPIIYEYSLEEGTSQKHLTPGIGVGVDLVREIPKHWPYIDAYDKFVVRSKQRNECIEALIREGVKRKKFVVCLVERVKHVERLMKRMKDLKVAAVYGKIKKTDRMYSKSQFEKEKLQVLICNKVFKKGVDIKRADVIIDAASMKSTNDARQKYGRGVRLHEAKQGLIYFDLGDRKPEGLDNRFQRSAASRRRALKAQGVYTIKTRWLDNPGQIYDEANKHLKKILKSYSTSK